MRRGRRHLILIRVMSDGVGRSANKCARKARMHSLTMCRVMRAAFSRALILRVAACSCCALALVFSIHKFPGEVAQRPASPQVDGSRAARYMSMLVACDSGRVCREARGPRRQKGNSTLPCIFGAGPRRARDSAPRLLVQPFWGGMYVVRGSVCMCVVRARVSPSLSLSLSFSRALLSLCLLLVSVSGVARLVSWAAKFVV